MDADSVLATARSGAIPEYWHVWPLRRERVRTYALKWGAESAFGLLLFVPVVFITVPGNFQDGSFKFALTGLLLVLLGAVAFGGLAIALYDIRRYLHAGEYLLVMTPDDFVKAEPKKVTHVPMEHVSYVTLRGVKSAFEEAVERDAVFQRGRSDPVSRLATRGATRRATQAPSLAFLDDRTSAQVVVATDDAFDDLAALEYVLYTYADAKQRNRTSGS